MLRIILISALLGSGAAEIAMLVAPYVVPKVVSVIDRVAWDRTYKASLVRYHFHARLPDGHLLLDERGDGLRFDSQAAADAYATDYAQTDRRDHK